MVTNVMEHLAQIDHLRVELDLALHPTDEDTFDTLESTDPGVRLERELEPLNDMTMPVFCRAPLCPAHGRNCDPDCEVLAYLKASKNGGGGRI